jgi:hypothetical protein
MMVIQVPQSLEIRFGDWGSMTEIVSHGNPHEVRLDRGTLRAL